MNPRRPLLALTLILLAAPVAAPPAEAIGWWEPHSDPILVREGAWLDSELDSAWTALEPGAYLLRLKRPTGAWIVETWYFRLAEDPTRVLTHDEFLDLRAAGTVEPWEVPDTVVDQVLVYAQDEAQAVRLARAMRPLRAPARVLEAVLERTLAEAEATGC